MKNGAIIVNSGHFDNEIDVPYLDKISKDFNEIRPDVREYHLKDGRTIYLLAEGRLVNLSAAEGHPSEVMDMSFANQALSAEWLTKKENIKNLENKVYSVPEEIDKEIARLEKEMTKINGELDRVEKKLSNENFLSKAPADIIEREKGKRGELEEIQNKLRDRISKLS